MPGFKEYEETRKKLEMSSSVVDGNIKITNSDLIKYKVNWFNVCMGIDIFDTGFENKVASKLNELGIKPFKRDKLLEKIDIILKDKELTTNFKNAIYERLMENCKEPEDFINNKKICDGDDIGLLDKFLGVFRKCHEKEMKESGNILYLNDKYRSILNRNKTIINNVDMVLILLNCEIRQRILSYHISVEIIRRRNSNNSIIKSILENIYNIDKPVIKQVEEELKSRIAQEKIERMKLVEQVNKEEIEMRKKQMLRKTYPELIEEIRRKKQEENQKNLLLDIDGKEKIEQGLALKQGSNDKFIEEHDRLLRMDRVAEDYKIAAPAAGGGIIYGGKDEDEDKNIINLDSDMLEKDDTSKKHMSNDSYDIYNQSTVTSICNDIRDKKTITRDHLIAGPILNKCPRNF